MVRINTQETPNKINVFSFGVSFDTHLEKHLNFKRNWKQRFTPCLIWHNKITMHHQLQGKIQCPRLGKVSPFCLTHDRNLGA